ncbi:beta-lactamase domain-containing protein [Thermodesulfobium narugense DSM 14796]|uniref:Beta-lactamase domain-containing protein n=1 Tax=Thermodesulfobium narugense DSM 14796 TaxID=747365 RepID=M1E6V8_9BACT|nr:FprA family A-type flavoprotein [Thermodesulfobium narugense]AEE13749.1 beta-lactamase domain-containing protein [Thermodesulfobium narugense DSM 14796]
MSIKKISEGVWSLRSIDWDRRIFDELISLPYGTTYNAYLVRGSEKCALIDSTDPTKTYELINDLKRLNVRVDYVISNHAEQDHSGSIGDVLNLNPDAMVVTNSRCKDFLIDLLHIDGDRFLVVKDGDKLELGSKTLQFKITPWVHWPETMITLLEEEKILFTCDFLGSHIATSELYVTDESLVYLAAKRYYSEVMMPFRNNIKKNIEVVKDLAPKIIAPSHGPVYQDPRFIISATEDWISDRVKNLVLIPYVSMHGSTKILVERLVQCLIDLNIEVMQFSLTKTDVGEIATHMVDAATIVLATPTILLGPHPAAVYAAYLVAALKPKTKYFGLIGSYGWGSKVVDIISNVLSPLKPHIINPVLIKGMPNDEDLKKIDDLANQIHELHKNL